MRIDEKTRNVHFQWERDSSRCTPTLICTLYGKSLTLYLMYSLICSRNLNIIEYTKPTAFFIFLRHRISISCFDDKGSGYAFHFMEIFYFVEVFSKNK